jgi:hypothetical protein
MQQSVRQLQAISIDLMESVDLAPGVREHEWVRSNSQEYAGKWVALMGSRLIAVAEGAREAMEKAKAAGVRAPFLVHLPDVAELPFGGW